VAATTDPDSEVANRWIARLGFVDTGVVVDGKKVHLCTL
jgi:hypothetical protein